VAFVVRCEDVEPLSGHQATRSWLSHDWLKHQVLHDVHAMRRALLDTQHDHSLPDALVALPLWIEEVRKFAGELIPAFSPRQLVSYGPLSGLPNEIQALVASALDDAYLALNVTQPIAQRIAESVAALESVGTTLRAGWGRQTGNDLLAVQTDEFERVARDIHDALASLPEGVVVP